VAWQADPLELRITAMRTGSSGVPGPMDWRGGRHGRTLDRSVVVLDCWIFGGHLLELPQILALPLVLSRTRLLSRWHFSVL